jgi:hypothetical protein
MQKAGAMGSDEPEDYTGAWMDSQQGHAVLRCDVCGRETYNFELEGDECRTYVLRTPTAVMRCMGILRMTVTTFGT